MVQGPSQFDRLDGVNEGIAKKAPVRVGTTANITLSGLQAIDGVTVVENDRVLVKNQDTATENGIYWASTGEWTRCFDFNGNRDIVKGSFVFVTAGSTLSATLWYVTTTDPITIDEDDITWSQWTGAGGASANISYVTVNDESSTFSNSRQATAGTGITLTDGGASSDLTVAVSANTRTATANFIIDGGGSAITTGVKGDIKVDFACDIAGATLLADQSGSIVVDIWKKAFSSTGYPPTVANTITASAKPTIASTLTYNSTTLTGWTTSVAAGDTFRFNVDSITTLTRCTVVLKLVKNA